MAKDVDDSARGYNARADHEENEETRSLLSSSSNDSDPSDIVVHKSSPPPSPHAPAGLEAPTPRTAHRVRFQLDDTFIPPASNGNADFPPYSADDDDDSRWADEEDYLSRHAVGGRSGDDARHRAPLLTGIEAPSVTVASAAIGFNAEDLLESARPKSGMRSAFMNMANSIM
ncbi:MAG: hypothetical protein M1837_003583 [Sclerophora amabilis]|nr:MAG: hypothetical protein M1837_003583 [Sclerophora amabilis]